MIYSENEWDDLKKVVVGSATNAHWPVKCNKFRQQEKTTSWMETPVPTGPVEDDIIKSANDDLDNFCKVLKNQNIIVKRPIDLNFKEFDGLYNYCPRDRVLIIGDKIIDAPMVYPTRIKEIDALSHLFDKDVISCNDPEVFFDAANICRLGKDLLYLVSQSGNKKGAEWLQKILGQSYKVHVLDNIYSGVHIDSTISPVREGLVVLNSDRINGGNCPKIFESWDKIYVGSNEIVSQNFHKYPYASKYIALNFLAINSSTIICDPKQKFLINELEKRNIKCLGVELRQSRTLGGGHHCVTLDLQRD